MNLLPYRITALIIDNSPTTEVSSKNNYRILKDTRGESLSETTHESSKSYDRDVLKLCSHTVMKQLLMLK